MKDNDFIEKNSYYDGNYIDSELSGEERERRLKEAQEVCKTFETWEDAWEYDQKLNLHSTQQINKS